MTQFQNIFSDNTYKLNHDELKNSMQRKDTNVRTHTTLEDQGILLDKENGNSIPQRT